MVTEMDTIINNQQTISQATAIMEITETMDSMAIQAIDHKMISNQLLHTRIQATNTYLHRQMHLNLNHNHHDQTISTFHQHKIKIAQMATATVISIHKADIDTKAIKAKTQFIKWTNATTTTTTTTKHHNNSPLQASAHAHEIYKRQKQTIRLTTTINKRTNNDAIDSFRLCTIPLSIRYHYTQTH